MTTTLDPPAVWPVHPDTGFPALGLLGDGRPVWPALGAAEDDDGDTGMDLENPTGKGGKKPPKVGMDLGDDDQDADEGAEDTAEDEDDEEWKPPTREEYEQLQAQVAELGKEKAKATTEARQRRQEIRTLKKQQAAATSGTGEGDTAPDKDAMARAVTEAAEAAERRLKPIAIRAAARAKFLEVGLNDQKAMNRLLRMLDVDDIDLDDDGDPVGLDEQIDDIKDDLPKLFERIEPAPEPARKRPGAPRITGADRRSSPPEPKTTGEKIAARVLRGA